MSTHSEFVKGQISFHEDMADRFKANPKRSSKHIETAEALKALLDYIESLESRPATTADVQAKRPLQLSLSFDEIEGLPAELIQELSVSDGDRTDFAILKIVEAAGGIASLDRILVGLYKETGEIMKRTTLTSRMYRMSQKGLIFSIPGKKGAYSLEELTEDQVEQLISK